MMRKVEVQKILNELHALYGHRVVYRVDLKKNDGCGEHFCRLCQTDELNQMLDNFNDDLISDSQKIIHIAVYANAKIMNYYFAPKELYTFYKENIKDGYKICNVYYRLVEDVALDGRAIGRFVEIIHDNLYEDDVWHEYKDIKRTNKKLKFWDIARKDILKYTFAYSHEWIL